MLLAVNVTPREDSGKSAAEMVYGTTLTLPGQLASSKEMPVERILWDHITADPLPTRHAEAEAPPEPPPHLSLIHI